MNPAPRPFRFAVQGGPFTDPTDLARHARHVESLGYDELWSADHVGGVDPFAPLLAAAIATTDLRVGPLVINNELHNPVLLARTAATVDALTGGRLVLGLGTGYAEAEHTSIGSPIRRPGPRVGRFAASLAALRTLLDDGEAHVDDDHLTVDVDDLGVRPAQAHVPFLIGGHGSRVVRLAARFADIFQFTGLVHGDGGAPTAAGFPIEQLDRRARWLTDAAADRDDDIERSALVQLSHVGDDAPTADALSNRFGLAADDVADTPFVQAGSLERIVDRLERHRSRLGISHYVVRDSDGFAPVVDALRGR